MQTPDLTQRLSVRQFVVAASSSYSVQCYSVALPLPTYNIHNNIIYIKYQRYFQTMMMN